MSDYQQNYSGFPIDPAPQGAPSSGESDSERTAYLPPMPSAAQAYPPAPAAAEETAFLPPVGAYPDPDPSSTAPSRFGHIEAKYGTTEVPQLPDPAVAPASPAPGRQEPSSAWPAGWERPAAPPPTWTPAPAAQESSPNPGGFAPQQSFGPTGDLGPDPLFAAPHQATPGGPLQPPPGGPAAGGAALAPGQEPRAYAPQAAYPGPGGPGQMPPQGAYVGGFAPGRAPQGGPAAPVPGRPAGAAQPTGPSGPGQAPPFGEAARNGPQPTGLGGHAGPLPAEGFAPGQAPWGGSAPVPGRPVGPEAYVQAPQGGYAGSAGPGQMPPQGGFAPGQVPFGGNAAGGVPVPGPGGVHGAAGMPSPGSATGGSLREAFAAAQPTGAGVYPGAGVVEQPLGGGGGSLREAFASSEPTGPGRGAPEGVHVGAVLAPGQSPLEVGGGSLREAFAEAQPTGPVTAPAAAAAVATPPARTGSPIIDPGVQPAVITLGLGALIGVAALAGKFGLVLPVALLQAVTAAGWFRLNGMWPARQGIALAALGGFVADAAILAASAHSSGPAIIAGTLGAFFMLVLILQIFRPSNPDERFYALTVCASATVVTVLAGGFLAVGSGKAVLAGALAAGVSAAVSAVLRKPPVVGFAAGGFLGLLVGGGVAAATGLGLTEGLLLGLGAGVCALVGRRVAAFDFPSRFVHMTAGVALPLALAAPMVYLIAR